ncbi:hypothetical protein AVEN_247647-1 [Araneus ventricosus]|uniref:Uncharacterized protein n=1 Tax=Araneus ventricosus TaxID=182803 RepID=A0A4Y2VF22_ARAVE|nr:hypothetical protein AVEN_247647-1 [Araneus ventricosus]
MKEAISAKRLLVMMLENKISVNEQQNPVGRKFAQPPPFSPGYRKDYLGNENFPATNDEHSISAGCIKSPMTFLSLQLLSVASWMPIFEICTVMRNPTRHTFPSAM